MEKRPSMHTFEAVRGDQFEVDRKYEFIRIVGRGAYGIVVSAKDQETGRKVAIKKIANAFSHREDAKRILREIRLLRQFDHDHIIRTLDILWPSSLEFDDVYIVSELMETDLQRVIYSREDLSLDHIQYFMIQIFRALKYMHSANVIHRDLKPQNILVNSDCELKICDLGLARSILKDRESNDLTEYVATRWYRAPEIMLECEEYSHAIDIWSAGCIMAELFKRRALFPGDNGPHQISLIVSTLGRPSSDDLEFIVGERSLRFVQSIDAPPAHEVDLKKVILGSSYRKSANDSNNNNEDGSRNSSEIPRPDRVQPEACCRGKDGTDATDRHARPVVLQCPKAQQEQLEQAFDLVSRMLLFNPRKRISIDEALRHPFIYDDDEQQLRGTSDLASFTIDVDEDLNGQTLLKDHLRELIWREMVYFHPDAERCLAISKKRKRESDECTHGNDENCHGEGGNGDHNDDDNEEKKADLASKKSTTPTPTTSKSKAFNKVCGVSSCFVQPANIIKA